MQTQQKLAQPTLHSQERVIEWIGRSSPLEIALLLYAEIFKTSWGMESWSWKAHLRHSLSLSLSLAIDPARDEDEPHADSSCPALTISTSFTSSGECRISSAARRNQTKRKKERKKKVLQGRLISLSFSSTLCVNKRGGGQVPVPSQHCAFAN